MSDAQEQPVEAQAAIDVSGILAAGEEKRCAAA